MALHHIWLSVKGLRTLELLTSKTIPISIASSFAQKAVAKAHSNSPVYQTKRRNKSGTSRHQVAPASQARPPLPAQVDAHAFRLMNGRCALN